jgi:hypothetical protein
MARTRTRTAPVPEHNALVASAVRMPPIPMSQQTGKTQAWQGTAWNYYNTIGELRFVSNWVGSVMSRAHLVAAKDIDGVLVVQKDGPAAEAMAEYHGGMQGQSQMLQQSGIHLTNAGEMWDVYHEKQWHSLAYNKVTRQGGQIKVDFGDGKGVPLAKDGFAIRLWTPHPVEPLYADSPVRSNLGTLAELASLNAHVRAQLTSRLAGAGILLMPSEITFPTPKEADPAASQADNFMATLAEAMLTPISEPDSPSAVVPIVVQAPGEFLGDVKHVTFWTELDEKVIEMRDSAVKRLALGLDTPPEILLGMGESNHWSAWLVDEASVKSHLEPRLGVVCQALTDTYLRPALTDVVNDSEDYYVVADTSDIRLRPNRSREAIELWDRGELSGEAVRRETGFKPEDAPDSGEMRSWLLRKIAAGSTSPEQTQAALRLLGADLGMLDLGGSNTQITPVLDNRRSLEDHPENRVPDSVRSEKDRRPREGMIAAADALVYRALERVGNKLCNGAMKAQLADTPAHWRYMYVDAVPESAIDGAWVFAAEVLEATDNLVDTARICAALDGYVRFIVNDRRKHHRDLLEAALIAAGVVDP